MTEARNSEAVSELMHCYERWRAIYASAGKAAPDEPNWDDDARLWFRFGYPYPDWTAFVIERQRDGYRVSRASTERRNEPVISPQGLFSTLELAGKYIIAKTGNYLRIECRLDPVTWAWEDAGLQPKVGEIVTSDREVKYYLRSDENTYFIMTLADRPYSHILPLTYDELTDVLLQGFPDDLVAGAG